MAWWAWLLIWVGLSLAMLGMLTWSGVRLFKKFMAVTHALGDLLDKVDLLESRTEELRAEPFEPAIFADASQLSDQRERDRADRERVRQIRRDSRVSRGKLLLRADARQFSYLIRRS